MKRFRDRAEAGRMLALELEHYRGTPGLIVVALPRGGVPVGFELARSLGVPLDVLVVRKLGVPGQEELALGAIASGGVRVLNDRVVAELGLRADAIEHAVAAERDELARRESLYRGEKSALDVAGRVVLLVDDGLATGATMRVAALALRAQQPQRIVIAVPVAAARTCDELRAVVDQVVCLRTPWPFLAVGAWYEDFDQTSDEEVGELLARSAVEPGG